jgi:hypothetical protein
MECTPRVKTTGMASQVLTAIADTQTRIGLLCKTNNIKISTDSTRTNMVTIVQAVEASTGEADVGEASE